MWSQIRKNKMLSLSINGHICVYGEICVLLNRKHITAYFMIIAMKTFTPQ